MEPLFHLLGLIRNGTGRRSGREGSLLPGIRIRPGSESAAVGTMNFHFWNAMDGNSREIPARRFPDGSGYLLVIRNGGYPIEEREMPLESILHIREY